MSSWGTTRWRSWQAWRCSTPRAACCAPPRTAWWGSRLAASAAAAAAAAVASRRRATARCSLSCARARQPCSTCAGSWRRRGTRCPAGGPPPALPAGCSAPDCGPHAPCSPQPAVAAAAAPCLPRYTSRPPGPQPCRLAHPPARPPPLCFLSSRFSPLSVKSLLEQFDNLMSPAAKLATPDQQQGAAAHAAWSELLPRQAAKA